MFSRTILPVEKSVACWMFVGFWGAFALWSDTFPEIVPPPHGTTHVASQARRALDIAARYVRANRVSGLGYPFLMGARCKKLQGQPCPRLFTLEHPIKISHYDVGNCWHFPVKTWYCNIKKHEWRGNWMEMIKLVSDTMWFLYKPESISGLQPAVEAVDALRPLAPESWPIGSSSNKVESSTLMKTWNEKKVVIWGGTDNPTVNIEKSRIYTRRMFLRQPGNMVKRRQTWGLDD